MRVAGLGFRAGVPEAALDAAIDAAGGAGGLDALATIADKAPDLASLAARMGLPVRAIPADWLRGVATPTVSARITARHGTGSLAEAAALVAAGPGARVVAVRAASPCGRATAAIAEGDGS